MKRLLVLCITAAVVAGSLSIGSSRLGARDAGAESGTAPKTPTEAAAGQEGTQNGQQLISASRAAREEKAIQDARRQQLAEKEAAVAAKEQELKKLSAKIEAQIKALEDSKKRLDDGIKSQNAAQKKLQDEKLQKMVKLFKTMRGEQAGQMINNLQEPLAMALLSRLDTKTVAKLAPFINQPRVVKWVSENLQGK
jgi:flagellar motility protein MotE (MotC chaperone)